MWVKLDYLPDKELANGGTAQQWWVEMQMQVRDVVGIMHVLDTVSDISWNWFLVDAHGVREGRREEVVVSSSEVAKYRSERFGLGNCQVQQGGDMSLVR